ncbi:MAG: carboxypeptidase M32 [Planctomycetaceae bacterium]|nr:carboxypeptidase M32 [Planctomycetaceae bacterium]
MTAWEQNYEELVAELRRNALLESCGSVLGWERETYMPEGGTELRSRQLSLLAGLRHQWSTSPRLGELLRSLASEDLGPADGPVAVNVGQACRDYDLATRLPQKLVEEISRVTALSQHAWQQAKKQNRFADFEPWLKQVVSLKREQAACLHSGKSGPVYDSLLDLYEPGVTTAEIQSTFAPLRDQLVPLVGRLAEASFKPDASLLAREYPIEQQRVLAREAAQAIGFDFRRGRIDESAHPFCSGFGPGDCRLTTRYDAHFFSMAFFGTLHEAGHGMYEQGLPEESFGLGMGHSVSLGIHESQSRMWENLVGRSRPFWQHFLPLARNQFPEALGEVETETFYRAINKVEPSWIRVEADEVTYNLHIMLRFELEQKLIGGELEPADVPGAWNEVFQQYLGITPPDDARGCLQDVHWSAGLIGYFPTYALGNIYASQFYRAAERELGDLSALFARGEFSPLRQWLNTNIHQRGQQYTAGELVRVVTGESFSALPLVEYLENKFNDVYCLT